MAAEDNIPLRLLAEGREQYIKVDQKMMLSKIMASVGYNSPPQYTEIDCGEEGVRFAINLDLSIGNENSMALVEGKPFKNKTVAETSAVLTAFMHLEEKGMLKVLDFSSRVSMSFSAYGTYGYVKDMVYSVDAVLSKFETTVEKCKDLGLELQEKGVDGKYISSFCDRLVKKFSDKTSTMRSKASTIQFEMMKHHKKITDKREAVASKGYLKKVLLPSRVLLDYLLSYLGLKNAKYSNGPDKHGMVKAVVKFKFPYFKQLKYGGKLKKKGKGTTSAHAEEDAAFEALLFIEENFNLKIVDLNFPERVDAENDQMMLMKLLEEIIDVGESVKEMWEDFVTALESKNEEFKAERTEDQNEDYKMCVDGLAKMGEFSGKWIGACWTMFDSLQEIIYKLYQLKRKLNMK